MAAAVPWSVLEAVIAPHYPKEGPQGGRRPFPIAVMLRIYFLQQWYNLSDPGAEEALYDIQSMRAFCDLELGRDPIPDETTILNFRHLLEAHELTKTVFEAVAEHLEAPGALLRGGTNRRCDINRRLAVHQERGGQARSADAFLEEAQSTVLRHEGARGRRCQQRACAHRGRDERQRNDAKVMDRL
jgi:IS5 family transposase